jgi:hypothetical protein
MQPGGSEGIILPYSVAKSQGRTDAKTGEYETEPQESQYGNLHPPIEATWSQEGLGHLPELQSTRLGCGTTGKIKPIVTICSWYDIIDKALQ